MKFTYKRRPYAKQVRTGPIAPTYLPPTMIYPGFSGPGVRVNTRPWDLEDPSILSFEGQSLSDLQGKFSFFVRLNGVTEGSEIEVVWAYLPDPKMGDNLASGLMEHGQLIGTFAESGLQVDRFKTDPAETETLRFWVPPECLNQRGRYLFAGISVPEGASILGGGISLYAL